MLEQPGTELLLFGFRQAQPSLLAPQDVFQAAGPFARDEVAHFRFVQPGAKVLAALLLQPEAGMGAIGLGDAQGAAIIQPVEFQRKARASSRTEQSNSPPGSRRGRSSPPHLAEPGLELVAGGLGQLGDRW